jgi:hypothetical protein
MIRRTEKPNIAELSVQLVATILEDIASQLANVVPFTFAKFKRDLTTVQERTSREGMAFLSKALPSLGKAFDKALSSDSVLVVPEGFSSRKYGTIEVPVFLGSLWPLVFDEVGNVRNDERCDNQSYCSHLAQLIAVRGVRQVCYLMYKLEGQHSKESERELFDQFVQVDESLPDEAASSEDVLPDWRARIALERAAILTYYVQSNMTLDAILPKHGPGAVANGEKYAGKMQFKRFFPKLDKVYSYPEYFFHSYTHLCDELEFLEGMDEHASARAKAVLVPKDSRGPRLISMEPLELQWIQQGVARLIRERIESSPLTRGFVNFRSQEINRRLAQWASLGWELSNINCLITLDLSEASDRVSVWLVKRLFNHWVDNLMACRSDETELPDGRVVKLKKFAPMGSACCFPVEALSFWAICKAALIRSIRNGVSFSDLPATVWVYGDDIIIHKSGYDAVKEALESCHLKLSEGKCCTGRFFRESCGFDAFKGECVTPIRIHKAPTFAKSPQALLAYMAYANAFQMIGYLNTSRKLEELIEQQLGPQPVTGNVVEFPRAFLRVGTRSEIVEENERRGYKLRYNKRLCRREFRFPAVKPVTINSDYRTGWDSLLERKPSKDRSEPASWSASLPHLNGALGLEPGVYTVPRVLKQGWAWVSVDRISPSEATGGAEYIEVLDTVRSR